MFLKQPSILFTGLIILLLAACAPQANQPPDTGAQPTQPPAMTALPETGDQPTQAPQASPTAGKMDPLANTAWQLESIQVAGTPFPVVSGGQVTLQFDDQGQAAGFSGCNSFGGRYQVVGSSITFSDTVSTLMACEDQQVMDLEAQYLEALRTAGSFTLAGDTLTIAFGELQGIMTFHKAEPGTALPPASTEVTVPSNETQPAPTATQGDY